MSSDPLQTNMDIPYEPKEDDKPPERFLNSLKENFPPKDVVQAAWWKSIDHVEKSYTGAVYRQLRALSGIQLGQDRAFTIAFNNTRSTSSIGVQLEEQMRRAYHAHVNRTMASNSNTQVWISLADYNAFDRSEGGELVRKARLEWLVSQKERVADKLKLTQSKNRVLDMICKRVDLVLRSTELGIDWESMEMLHYYRLHTSGGVQACDIPTNGEHQKLFLAALTPRGRFIAGQLQDLHCITGYLQLRGTNRDDFLKYIETVNSQGKYALSKHYSTVHEGALAGWTKPTTTSPSSSHLTTAYEGSARNAGNPFVPRRRQSV
ncbi:uncharacterized protein JCM6883_000686 [Sporobolomyces salmoneus]|uniref:uncharacterized protein n=1 Tax=Sporobolomyces salmoneus TaxID=183962 RepID=UPI003177B95C